jgi:hypothetical protein
MALILAASVLLMGGCKISYSFTGASISPDVKTVSVQYFPNRARIINPTLSQEFTDALKDKIRGQTSLVFVNDLGDVDFEGEITDYRTEPVAIAGDDRANLTRFTVSIRVKYTNSVDGDQDFERVFTKYEDFDSNQDFSSVEQTLIEEVIEAITEDIFNAAFVNW